MAQPHTWGDELTLTAASHLLLRRIVVISDNELEIQREFTPPAMISQDVWGPDIFICHMLQNHYEATEVKQPSSMKREPRPSSS